MIKRLGQNSARLLMGTTLLFVAIVVGLPTSASATSEWGHLISSNSLPSQQMCLTAAAATDWSVWQNSCNWQANDIWHMKPIGDGYYNIVNPWGKCLDAYAFNHDNYGRITTWDCNGYINQQWKPYFSLNGFELKPRHAEYDNWRQGKCLDVYAYAHYAGAPVVQWDCLGGVNQLWIFSGWQ
jgi:hypothetical protein